MTVSRHEEWLEEIAKLEKEEKYKKNRGKFEKEMNQILVWKTLQIIDESVSLDDIKNMHVADFVFLSNNIWEAGRELTKGEEKDFRKTM